jgi:GNAT superfamily N-acetyltransferase
MNNLSFTEMARLIERKQGTSLEGLAREVVPVAEGWMIFDVPGSPVNKVCGLGFGRPPTEAELEGLVTFFTQHGAEPKVELSPFAPPALMEGLAQRGFVLREFENVLVRELPPGAQPRAMMPGGWPEGITVHRVDPSDEAAVREQSQVAFSGFFPEGTPMPEGILEFGMKCARTRGYDLFVARCDGEVVGAGGCESGEGITLLFGTSVKASHRRRGIQQALMVARLERGQELGSQLAVINSRPGIPTERNAARIGFRMAYSRAVLVKPGPGLVPSP